MRLCFKGAAVALGVFACGGQPGNNAASHLVKHPEVPSDSQAKCKVAKKQSEPLIVEWPDSARGKLESMTKRGLVAVRYEGCELEVLSQCRVKGNYGYQPITRKQSRVTIKDEDDLYASMPVGAVKLEGKLKTAGQLNVQMTIVGRYEAPGQRVFKDDLEGECAGATHVVAALTVGSFTFFAGSDAEVGAGAGVGVAGINAVGGGAKSLASKETLQKDGDEASCARSSAGDKNPPEGCGALLQIEVFPISKSAAKTAAVVDPVPLPVPVPTGSAAPSASPASLKNCKPPMKIKDGECIDPKKPRTDPPMVAKTCPYGQHLEGSICVADSFACPNGTHREGSLCVDDYPKQSYDDPKPTPKPYTPPEDPNAGKPQEVPNPWRGVLAYGALGLGIGGLSVGGYALAASKTATDLCNEANKTCGPDYESKKKTAMGLAIAADVMLVGGIACGVLAFVLPAKTTVGVAPTPGGGYVSAGKAF